METVKTCSEEETEQFAVRLAETVPFGTVLALYGNLGAGKTVFARGFAQGFGVEEPISSPTFTIIQEYRLSKESSDASIVDREKWLYHIDLYRIPDTDSALGFGIDEYLEDKAAVTLIEWAERIEDILPEATIRVNISYIDEHSRSISIDLKA